MIFVHFKFNNTLNKRDNLALRANFVTWYFFLAKVYVCNMKLLVSPKHTEDELVLGDKRKKVKYPDEEMEAKRFCFSQNANFLIIDEQELI